MALGAAVISGFDLVAGALDLRALVAAADLVVTGEGRVDAQSLRGKVVVGLARLAQEVGVPCVVVAGQAEVGRRDAAAAGVDDIEAVADLLGSADAARAAGTGGVEQAASAMARRWVRRGI
jgi:glycerate kinase